MGCLEGGPSSVIAYLVGIRSATKRVTSKLWYLKKVSVCGLARVASAVVESDRGDAQHPGGRPGGGPRRLASVVPSERVAGGRCPWPALSDLKLSYEVEIVSCSSA